MNARGRCPPGTYCSLNGRGRRADGGLPVPLAGRPMPLQRSRRKVLPPHGVRPRPGEEVMHR